MNLSRAKTLLICAFLGLNLLLCYHLFGGEIRKLTRVAVSAAELRQTVRQLEDYGYLLETKADRAVRKSAFLTVAPLWEVGEKLREEFTAAAAPESGPSGAIFYDGDEAKVKLYPAGLARVEFNSGQALPDEVSFSNDQELTSAFELFLQELGPAFSEARLDYLERYGEEAVLHYVQLFEDMPLYSGYLTAFLENNRLQALEIYWLVPDKPLQEKEMEVIPVTEALLKMAEYLGPSTQPRRIIKAELGFYSCEYDAEKWEVPPVWRFLFEDGESCFINAFTGNLEREISN